MTKETLASQKKVSPFEIMASVIAASFGVTTQANRERDFKQGNFIHFVIGGIVFTILFVLLLVGIVMTIMYVVGA
ncbi:hypothetical protein MNBD_GAMMA05-128 [hydrothermal vent metagenome]|uniref:DUF2970 domain-containing protein n=1 Tax=hydrothermal vent metagenome TaxID=652676 RepID=A0A3B0WSY3_9ZZZZ